MMGCCGAIAVLILLLAAKDEPYSCLTHHEGKTHEPKTLILTQLDGTTVVMWLWCLLVCCIVYLWLLEVHSYMCVRP